MTGLEHPYSDLVGTRDPIEVLSSSPRRIAQLVEGWDTKRWARSYAPGKWSAAQVVLHLLHDELAWSIRIRYALTVADYVPRPFEGADWVRLESPAEGPAALEAFLALRRLNLLLYRRLKGRELAQALAHPEFGTITVEWVLRVLAGHDLHHIKHLEAIAAG
jgi:hypothetical protein